MNLTSKTQIDRLGDRLRKGKIGEDELRQLDEFRRSFAGAYKEVVSAVRKAAQLEPTGRPAKSTTSIVEKLRRETMRLSQMQDIAGCRLVVQDVLQQDQVVAQLMGALAGAEVVDRRKQPSHGYRAVHIIATAQEKPVEIQVRTELQHLWAQLSEKLSDVFDPAIKYGGGSAEAQEVTSNLSVGIRKLEAWELGLGGRAEMTGGQVDLKLGPNLSLQELADLKEGFRRFLEDVVAKLDASSRQHTGD